MTHDLSVMEANDTTAAAKSHPETAVMRADDRVNGAVWEAGRRVGRLPGSEPISVEAQQARRSPQPQIPFEVLRDCKHVAGGSPFSDAQTAIV